MKFIVAQLGARMHYAVPRILAEAKMLERFYTDFCASKGWPNVSRIIPESFQPKTMRRILGRVPHGVPAQKITAFNLFGLEYVRRLRRNNGVEALKVYLWGGAEFCRRVLAKDFGSASAVYTFNSAGLEILQKARSCGLAAVMEQTIAPKRIERELLDDEHRRFPDWERPFPEDGCSGAFIQREEAEWQAAHLIICGSEFVREGIARCGGPAEKCVVVPYGVDIPEVRSQKSEVGKPLRVLAVGTVGLRKGSPYVLEAAKQLKGRAVFRMVGGVGVTQEAQTRLREHVELTGIVPRNEIAKHFSWADVFLLPSLCEGSATVTYEALAHGLPVICTPNTGSVVRDGEDGFIVSIRNASGIVECLETLANDDGLYARMRASAHVRARAFTLAAYGERLLAALNHLPAA